MDINNHQHDIKEEEFLNNESTIQEANKLTKLLTDSTEKMPLNNENEVNTINVYKHSIIEKDEEFLDNKIDRKAFHFQKDFKHQILLNNFNTEQCINRIICVEDDKEFLDESLNILKDSNQQVLVKHNNCSIDVVEECGEEFGHNDSIQDVIEISKTEYTLNKSYVYLAKDMEINSNILENNNDINGLIKDYSCDYCFKSFSQLHHLKTHLSVHTNVYKKLPQKEMKSNVSTESPNHIQGSKHSTQIDKISVNENGDETIDLTSSRFNADNTLKVQNYLSNASQHIQIPQTSNKVNKFPKSKITQMYNRCSVCNKIFNFQRDLIKHAQDIHSNEKALKCRECNKCFSNVLSLSRHFKMHKDISKSSVCKAKSSKAKIAQFGSEQVNHEVFKENYEKETNLTFNHKNHEDLLELTSFEENSITNDTPRMKTYESDQIIKISENIIGEYDKNLTTLKSLNNKKTTKRTAFQTNKKHKCKFCLKFFTTSYVLKRHLTTHTGERPYYCSLCKRTFSRSDSFKVHNRRHLNSNFNEISKSSVCKTKISKNCTFCSKSFKNISSLKSHLRIHSGERPFSCAICKTSFNFKGNLKRHLRVHLKIYTKERPFSCTSCEASFYNMGNLKTHQRIHFQPKSKIKSNPKLTKLQVTNCKEISKSSVCKTKISKNCTFCSKSFKNISSLKSHLRIHTGERPFSCAICKTSFNFKGNLKRHLRVHLKIYTEERPFSCTSCESSFYNMGSLKTHQRMHFQSKSKIESNPKLTKLQVTNCKEISKSSVCKTKNSETKEIQLESQKLNVELFLNENDETETNLTINHENNKDSLELTSLKENSISNDKQQMQKDDYEQVLNIPVNESTNTKIEDHDKNLKTLKSSNSNIPVKRTAFQTNEKHKCKFCLKYFARSFVLQRHLTTHTGERPYSCSLCKRSFSRSDNFKVHKRRHRNSNFTIESNIKIPKLQDTNCRYKVLKTTTNHKKEVTTETGTGENKSKLASSDVVDNMGNNVAKKDAPFLNSDKSVKKDKNLSCTICYKSFKSSGFLESHLIKHTGKRPFVCTICERSFSTKFNLKRHQQKHFDSKSLEKLSLKRHQQKTSKLSVCKTKIFKNCTFCSKSFKSIASLKSHLIIHTGERPFSCNICETSFNRKGNLKRHQRNLHSESKIESNIKTTKLQVTNCKEISKSSVSKNKTSETKEVQLESQQLNVELFLKEDEYNLTFKGKSNKDSLELTSLKENSFTNDNQQMQKGDGKQVLQITENIKSKKTIFEEDDKNFTSLKSSKCKFCLKYFVNRNSLKRHLTTHTGKRPYSCSLCKSSFSCSFILKAHKRRHLNSKSKISLNSNKSVKKENKNLTCYICFESFKKRSHLKTHLMQHTGTRNKGNLKRHQQVHNKDSMELSSFKCKFCLKYFVNSYNLKRHLTIHTRELPYSCSLCKSSFSRSDILKRHKWIHLKKENMGNNVAKNNAPCSNSDKSVEKENNLTCTICSESFKSPCFLKIHLIKHTGKRPFICTICEKSFCTKFNLKRHQQKHFDSKSLEKVKYKRYHYDTKINADDCKILDNKCAVCCKIFDNIKDLVNHVNSTHTGETSFKCQHCDVTFRQMRYLRRHYKRKHLNETDKNYYCSYCQKSFVNKYRLKEHEGFHRRVLKNKFTCDICFKVFHLRNVFNQHIKTVHSDERPHSCALCDRSYKRHCDLLEHQRAVHLKKPTLSHIATENKCAICNKIFKFLPDLAKHVRQNHPNGNPFKCRDCSQTFTQVCSVKRHYKITHKEKLKKINTNDTTASIGNENSNRNTTKLDNSKKVNLASNNGEKVLNIVQNVANNTPVKSMELDINYQTEKNNTCEICNKSFDKKKNLKRHLIIHAAQSSFSDEKCDKSNENKKLTTISVNMAVGL